MRVTNTLKTVSFESWQKLDPALVALIAAQIGGRLKKDGGSVYHFEPGRQRYAMKGKIKKVSFDSDKHL